MRADLRTFHVVAPLPSLQRRTRLAKLLGYLKGSSSSQIVHAGWSREPGDFVEPNLSLEKKRLLSGGGYGSRTTRFLYFFWGLRVFLYCLKVRRQDTVWALGLESAFPAALVKRLIGFSLVFDDADRFAMLLNWPRPIKWIVERAEHWTSRNCTAHAVPNLSRYDYASHTFFLLENVPSRDALNAAKRRADTLSVPEGTRLVLNINGWLGSGRGMSTVFNAISMIPTDAILILLIGKIACKEAQQLATLPNVIALGEVSYSESLAWCFKSDLVFTYYDPVDPINIKAQSNKWGDAFLAGAGIVVNSEVERSDELVASGAARAIPYHDAESLARFLMTCLNSNQSQILRAGATRHGAQMKLFDDFLDELFNKIVNGQWSKTSEKG